MYSGLGLPVQTNGRLLRARMGQGAYFGTRPRRLGQGQWFRDPRSRLAQGQWFRDPRARLGQEGDLFDVGSWIEGGGSWTPSDPGEWFSIPEMSFTPVDPSLSWDWAARDAAVAAGVAPTVPASTDWFGTAGNIFQTAFPAVMQAATTTLPLWLPLITGQPAPGARPAPPAGYAYNPQGQLVRTTPAPTTSSSWTPLLLIGGAAAVGGFFLLRR